MYRIVIAIALAAAGTQAWAQQRQPFTQAIPPPARAYAPNADQGTASDVVIVTDPDGPRNMAPDQAGDARAADAARNAKALKGTLDDPDYLQAIESFHLLSPTQIEDMRRRQEEADLALANRAPPDSTTKTVPVTMRPGTPPQEILLSDNYLTALTLLDSEGAAWPIAVAQAGNPELFEVTIAGGGQEAAPQQTGAPQGPPQTGARATAVAAPTAPSLHQNVLIITPRQKYAASNLFIMPVGASAPVMLALRTTREVSYFNANLVVDERGPMASALIESRPAVPVDSGVMRRILDGSGALTEGVRQITITGAPNTTAFIMNDRMYLRTPYALVFPGYVADIKGRGMRVYELSSAASLLTLRDGSGRDLDLAVDNATILDAAIARAASSREATGAYR